ncbi:MAG: hypothetical protein C4541_04985 [Candidatus Auribacter fodinae]|jgi:hypothetical protein|uniref:Uncharacterized protein n=1 Tax=Candidatus Auribacter fodinae TaxID=2093366 RepID=A0A3A4R1J5_9BACT|nr:MAG: hypothetical protein C4541_04985 [Candidatus Auribacter fodinae]
MLKILKNLLKKLKKNNSNLKVQEEYLEQIEALGNILAHKAHIRSNTKSILAGIDHFYRIIERLLKIKEENPYHYERIVYSDDLKKSLESDKDNADHLLSKPAEHQKPIFFPLQQIVKIHESALQAKSPEISRRTARRMIDISDQFSTLKDESFFINHCLENIIEMYRLAYKAEDESKYELVIGWYLVVYNDNNFIFDYLDLYNRTFFDLIVLVICNSDITAWKNALNFLTHGLLLRLDRYIHSESLLDPLIDNGCEEAFLELSRSPKIKTLDKTYESIYTYEQYTAWKNDFEEYYSTTLKAVKNKDIIPKLDDMRSDILSKAKTWYKINNLYNIVFAICAYCYFRKKFDFIKEIWSYNRPLSGMASTWGGHNIIPYKLAEILELYLNQDGFRRSSPRFEFNIDNQYYFDRVFILILFFYVQLPQKTSIDISFLEDVHKLNRLIFRKESLETALADVSSLDEDLLILPSQRKPPKFEKRQSEIEQVEPKEPISVKHFTKEINDLIQELCNQAEFRKEELKKEKPLSQNKVTKFINETLQQYQDFATFKGLYREREESFKGKIDIKNKGAFFSITPQLLDKEFFLDDWDSSLSHRFGEGIARSENKDILTQLLPACIPTQSIEELLTDEKFIEEMDDFVLLLVNYRRYDFMKKYRKYYKPPADIKGDIKGWFVYNDQEFSIKSLPINDKEICLLLFLNKNKLGRYVQHSPLNEGDDPKSVYDGLYINIKPFEEDRLFNITVEKRLAEENQKTTKEKIENELKHQVILKIQERYEIELPDDFQGYYINIDEEPE